MQPQAPGASTGWVSFDDDGGGGSGFGFATTTATATAAASLCPPSAPIGWVQCFDAPGPSASGAAQYAAAPLAAAMATSTSTSTAVGAAAAAPGAAIVSFTPLPSAVRQHPTMAAMPPPTTSAAAPPTAAFPSFAALYGGGVAPAAAGLASATPIIASPPADEAAATGSFIQRLPRPPASASRGSAAPAAAGDANPFYSQDAAPAPTGRAAPGASSNPFASGANPLGATAAARSLDPFADLSVRPALPRPPPMGSARSPTSTGGAAAAAGASAAGALGLGPGVMGAACAGLQPQAAAAGSPGPLPGGSATAGTGMPGMQFMTRRPPATVAALSPLTQPPAAATPVAAPAPAPLSVFPSFAAIHQQQKPATAPAAAQQPHFLDAMPSAGGTAALPAPTAAAIVVAPPLATTGPGSSPLAAATPQASTTRQGSGPLSGPGYGFINTSSFDAFLPTAKPPPPPAQGLTAAAAPPPPPPPYSLAINLPDATSSLLERGRSGSPHGLPPPPPYTEALEMPSLLPPPPPPSYDEAVALPAAVAPVSAAAEPSLGRFAMPLPRTDTRPQPAWSAFDDDVFGLNTAAPTRAAAPAPASTLNPPPDADTGPAAASSKAATAPPPPLPDQICVEVRLPPLKPKEAAWPKRLVASMGLMFAAPGVDGVAALQWSLHRGAGQGPCFALPPGAGAGLAAGRSTEDADAAPAASVLLMPPVSDLSTTCCMLLDDVSGSLWTGHKDGWVVRWSVEPGRVAAYDHHWRAHTRGKITSMTLSPWGDLWTAASGGTVRGWQYPTGLSASRPPIKLFECRRCRVAMGPVARSSAQRAHSKARLLCLGPSGRVVWSAGRTGVALWGAYDGDFLGSLTPGLQQDARVGAAGAGPGAGAGVYAGDTGSLYKEGGAAQQQMEINPVTGLDDSLVDRTFSPRLPLDPSEEADPGEQGMQMFKGFAGAAKLAVRLGKKLRQNIVESTGVGVTEAGGAGEMYGNSLGARSKVVALLPGLDSCVYVAYKRGWLEKYTEWGKLLWSREYGRGVELHSAALVGAALWLGCGDGAIRTAAAASGYLTQAWKAHDFPVVGLAHDAGASGRGSGLVYSLSENGSVRGWPAVPPAEAQRLAWRGGLLPSLCHHKLTVLAATWNVNETRPAPASLRKWLQPAAAADIVSISLQEVEVGTSSVARDAAVTLLSKGMLERGNQNAQWWSAELSAALAATGRSWVRVALRQMSGLVIVVFCRKELAPHVGEVATAKVACGVMGVGGNKGAVAVSMSVYRRRVMFVCSHFAAHQERVDERNGNYNKIVGLLRFDNTSKAAQQQQQQQQHQAGDSLVAGGAAFDPDVDASSATTTTSAVGSGRGPAAGGTEAEDDGHGPGLSDAALLVWAGDFNYRINASYNRVRELSCTRALAELYELDQCRIEMKKGTVFRGLSEPLPLQHPVFVPTYKYDKGESHKCLSDGRLELPYDSSEKQRVPAWTDRVFMRGSRPGSLDVAQEEVVVALARPSDYNCVLEVNDSDHKPVYALLQVQLPGYEQEQKRRHSLASVLAVHQAALVAPGGVHAAAARHAPQLVQASASQLELRPYITSALDIQNCSISTAFIVHVMAERRADPTSGTHALIPLPSWLEASPTTFALGPHQADGYGGGTGGSQGQARVKFRVLSGDVARATELVHLRFVLRPLWGCETLAGALGPAVVLTVR